MTDATTGPSHRPEDPAAPGGQLLALYKRMRTAGQLRRYLLVEYRCVHRVACLLARVYEIPPGFMLYRAAHTFWTTTTPRPIRLARQSRAETAVLLPDPPCSVHLGCDHGRFDRPAAAVLEDVGLARRTGRATGRRVSASPAPAPDARACGERADGGVRLGAHRRGPRA